jgi:putative NADH-flavin reductase
MRVLVLGASGASGRRILERALACGHHATGFARNPGNVGIEHSRLSLAAGDVTVASTVERAVSGHDAVVWAVGGHDRIRDPRGASRQNGVCALGTANVLAAMGRAGARRLICQSSWGVADGYRRAPLLFRWMIFPLLLRDELADKADQERLIRASDLEWTIVRPARLTDGPSTGRYRAAPQLTFSARARVTRADVADLIVRELDEPRFIGKTVEIGA